MYFDILHMECGELRHDRRTVLHLTDHMSFSRNGALNVGGRHLASMVLCYGWGRLWSDTYGIKRMRSIAEDKPDAKTLCTCPVLKSGVW